MYFEDGEHVYLARANVRQQAIRKILIHPELERIIVQALGFSETAYQAALDLDESNEN